MTADRIEAVLEREAGGWTVETATDASSALERIRSESFDCVVSEYDLPDSDGIELLERTRTVDPDLPFVLHVMDGSEAIASEAISAGVTDYVRRSRDSDGDGDNDSDGDNDGDGAALTRAVRKAVSGRLSPRTNGAEGTSASRHARRMETLIGNLPGIVYRCRNEPEWPFEFVKGESRSLTGYRAAELESDEVAWGGDIVHPDDQDAVWEAVQEAVDRGEGFEVTYRIRTKHGTTKWVWERGEIVDPTVDGRAMLEGFITDITERKRYERELEQRNGELERFTDIVSHDLRNPLNVARGRVELAQDGCESEHLDRAIAAHDRMEELIDDLLTLAQSGERKTETERIAVSVVAERAWRNVPTRDATLSTSIDRTVEADPGGLTQLFENLVRNAVEHGGDDAAVTVGEVDGGFYVEDDGPGIPEDDREDVFDAGYSTADDGTGFGLVIVEEIAAAHGWNVEAVDGEDEGGEDEGGEGGGARIEVTGVSWAQA
ncbi:hypothetical protein JCM31271_26080 [Halorubrum trueperi]